MSQKQEMLEEFCNHPEKGPLISRIHELLISQGLTCDKSARTLLYKIRINGLATPITAMRIDNRVVFSLPRNYWLTRSQELESILNNFASFHKPQLSGAVSSSQQSAGEILINNSTVEGICLAIEQSIAPIDR
jgi:hypothetical protein